MAVILYILLVLQLPHFIDRYKRHSCKALARKTGYASFEKAFDSFLLDYLSKAIDDSIVLWDHVLLFAIVALEPDLENVKGMESHLG